MRAKMQSNKNPHTLMVGILNGTTTLEDSVVVSYQIKHTFNTRSNNHTLWYLYEEFKDISIQKPAHGRL